MKAFLFLISLSFLFLNPPEAKDIAGTYIGKLETGYSVSSKRKKETLESMYTFKRLDINEDGHFSFSYNYWIWSSRTNMAERICNGTWKIKNDTLTLNSNYKANDFFIVEEFCSPTTTKGLVEIYFKSVNNKLRQSPMCSGADFWIDSKRIEYCNVGDTIYTKSDNIEEIRILLKPMLLEYVCKPKNKKSNRFIIKVNTDFEGENYFLEDCKFVYSKNTLIPITENKGISVDGSYRKE
jgi:hypothetical protein